MWSEDKITDYLKNNLNKERYEHSLRVKDTSIELANVYNEDIDKSKFAALIHDCAKNMSPGEIIDTVKKENYDIDEVSMKSPSIMHGLAASIIAKNLMNVHDEDILNAVAYHTTGRKNMSTLEKIIYIADYIEPMRNFDEVKELRRLAYNDLDEALLLSFNNTIKYVISKGQLLHKDTIEARNYMLMKRM